MNLKFAPCGMAESFVNSSVDGVWVCLKIGYPKIVWHLWLIIISPIELPCGQYTPFSDSRVGRKSVDQAKQLCWLTWWHEHVKSCKIYRRAWYHRAFELQRYTDRLLQQNVPEISMLGEPLAEAVGCVSWHWNQLQAMPENGRNWVTSFGSTQKYIGTFGNWMCESQSPNLWQEQRLQGVWEETDPEDARLIFSWTTCG